MATKAHSFKVLAPKDIAAVLNMIGVHPVVSAEAVDKPTSEIAQSFFQALGEFAYDMDAQQVKLQMPGIIQHYGQQHAEIFDEAMDVLTVFKLSKQLAMINLVEDFNLKDVWDPAPKRFRILLSAMINFCRYKEGKVTFITGMKEDLQNLDAERVEVVEKSNLLEQKLVAAQEQHGSELHQIREAEMEVQRVQSEVDKLQRQKQSADRVVEEAESALNAAKDRRKQQEEQKEQLREQVASLQGQIAESPEGIEQEIAELQDAVREERRRLEERSNEKRARLQRDQVLARLGEHLEAVRDELLRLAQAADAAAAAKEKSSCAQDQLAQVRQVVEARRGEETDLDQRIRQISLEHERGKQAHEDRVQELEARRQQALVQHQQLQAKRTEEQKQQHLLQTQRLELEAEVAAARRAHEAEVAELRERQLVVQRQAEGYMQRLDSLILQSGGFGDASSLAAAAGGGDACGVGRGQPPAACGKPGKREASPEDGLLRQRLASSPSPARVTANPLGFLSPGAQY